ncbi:MAG: hypothetical protein GF401_18295 [Chitinivibrionales bacterium]|nr:hypothetical protein [Chitinivibrionales bacterium]
MYEYIPVLFSVSIVIALSLLIKSLSGRLKLPPLTGWILLGFLLNFIFDRFDRAETGFLEVIEILGQIGVVVLLFNIGLHSKLGKLIQYFSKASLVWLINVVISGAASFGAARYLLDAGMVISMIIAVALTATSIGISVMS